MKNYYISLFYKQFSMPSNFFYETKVVFLHIFILGVRLEILGYKNCLHLVETILNDFKCASKVSSAIDEAWQVNSILR